MIEVRLPRWLGLDFKEKGRIRPIDLQLQLQCPGVSEAQMTLPRGAPVPAMHEWLEIFTDRGSVGFFRVTNTVKTYTGDTQVTLRHGVDTFADSYFAPLGDYVGTVADYMADIIAAQTARLGGSAPWQLGVVVNGTTSYPVKVNYDRLSDALNNLVENIPGTQLAYDFTTTPWTLSLIAQPQNVASEFRLGHNLSTLEVTFSDADLCTQLVLQVNAVDVESSTGMPDIVTPVQVTKTYNNATAQAQWGVVQQYAAIDTHDDLTQQTLPEADAWAANYLAKRAEPSVQIEIDGEELAAYTFEAYDETNLGYLCRVALPDYDAYFSERVVSITYPDVIGSPTHVTVSLANEVIKASGALKATAKTAKVAAAAAASAGRQANAAAGLSHWEAIVQDIKMADDATGITELYESGIVVDAQEGVTIYSLAQGFRSDYSAIKVNSEQIALRVRNGQVATQLSIECGNVTVSGGNLVVDGYILSNELESAIAELAYVQMLEMYAHTGTIDSLTTTNITALGTTSLGSVTVNGTDLESNAVSAFGTPIATGGTISIPFTYLDGSSGTPITFNIADTAFYQNGVASAYAQGVIDGGSSVTVDGIEIELVGSPYFNAQNVLMQDIQAKAWHYDGGGGTSYLGTDTATRSVMPAYNMGYTAGAASVSQRTAVLASSIQLGQNDTGISNQVTTVSYNDSTNTPNVPIQIDASNVYAKGYLVGEASVTLSGAWSGSKYTATATNGATVSTGNLAFSGSWGSGTSANLYSFTVKDGSTTIISDSINATARYNAGRAAIGISGSWNGATYTASTTGQDTAQTVSTTLVSHTDYKQGAVIGIPNYTAETIIKGGTSYRLPKTVSSSSYTLQGNRCTTTLYRESGGNYYRYDTPLYFGGSSRTLYTCSNFDTMYEGSSYVCYQPNGTSSYYYQAGSSFTYYTIPT